MRAPFPMLIGNHLNQVFFLAVDKTRYPDFVPRREEVLEPWCYPDYAKRKEDNKGENNMAHFPLDKRMTM